MRSVIRFQGVFLESLKGAEGDRVKEWAQHSRFSVRWVGKEFNHFPRGQVSYFIEGSPLKVCEGEQNSLKCSILEHEQTFIRQYIAFPKYPRIGGKSFCTQGYHMEIERQLLFKNIEYPSLFFMSFFKTQELTRGNLSFLLVCLLFSSDFQASCCPGLFHCSRAQ